MFYGNPSWLIPPSCSSMSFHTTMFYGNRGKGKRHVAKYCPAFHTTMFYGNLDDEEIAYLSQIHFPHNHVLRKQLRRL